VPDLMKHLHGSQWPAVLGFLNQSSLNYSSSTSVTYVLASIGSHFETTLIDDINKANYIALLPDE
jgi:hypothetical protein